MTDTELLVHKLGELHHHLARSRRRRGDDFAEFSADEDRQDALFATAVASSLTPPSA